MVESQAPITLLSGPPSCGKTSLLFEYALNHLGDDDDDDSYVVFLCNHHRLQTKPPPFVFQAQAHPLLHRIHFKYVDDDETLKKYLAAFHLLHPCPLAVIIDDFGDFFHESKCQERYSNARGRDLAMVRVLALCQSAVLHARTRAPCKLLLCDTHNGDTPRHMFLYKRWISSILTIEAQDQGEDNRSSTVYIIKAATDSGGKTAAKYSLSPQHLLVNFYGK